MTANYADTTAYLAEDYDYEDYDYDCAFIGDEADENEFQNNPAKADSEEEADKAANAADHEDDTVYVEKSKLN